MSTENKTPEPESGIRIIINAGISLIGVTQRENGDLSLMFLKEAPITDDGEELRNVSTDTMAKVGEYVGIVIPNIETIRVIEDALDAIRKRLRDKPSKD